MDYPDGGSMLPFGSYWSLLLVWLIWRFPRQHGTAGVSVIGERFLIH